MKRLGVLLVVAIITLLILLFLTHPEWLDKIWIWIIGFIGYILVLIEKGAKILSGALKNNPRQESTSTNNSLQEVPEGMATVSQVEMLEKRLTQIENQLQKQP